MKELFDKVSGCPSLSAWLYGVLNANVITTNKNVAIADNPYPNIEALAGPWLLNKILIITPPPNNPNKLIISKFLSVLFSYFLTVWVDIYKYCYYFLSYFY